MKASGSSDTDERPAERRRREQLRRLTRLSRALTYATELEQVLRLAVDQAAELFEAPKAVLMLTDGEGLLHVRASRGLDQERVQRFREPLDESLVHRLQGLAGGYDESFVGAPLVVRGEVTGLLGTWRRDETSADPSDEWLLSALADQAAVAVENARLSETVEHEVERSKAAQGASELRERALVTLSHDLRSPLNAIDSYAELMLMELYGPLTDRQRAALDRIRLSGRHLLSILEDVLQMARLTAGALRLRSEWVPAPEIIRQAVQMVATDTTRKRQRLHIVDGQDVSVVGDPDRLRQVLVNLLANASKYTPEGGKVEISLELRDRGGQEWGVISVSDDGPGIPADRLESIFEPYCRLEEHDGGGVGIGLTISRELSRQMGGDLEVESELGRGSWFRVWLRATR